MGRFSAGFIAPNWRSMRSAWARSAVTDGLAAASVGIGDSGDCGALAGAGRVVHPLSDRAAGGRGRAVAEAIRQGRRPAFEDADDALIHDFASELYDTKRVSDALYAKAVERFGHPVVSTLWACLGTMRWWP